MFLLGATILFAVLVCEVCASPDSVYHTDKLSISVLCFSLSVLPLLIFDWQKVRLSIIDFLLCLLLALYSLSAFINGEQYSKVTVEELIPYVLLYAATRIFILSGGRRALLAVFSLFFLCSCKESIIGLLQIFGHRPSGHIMFLLTGSFLNPGPYGGFIARSTSMAAAFLISRRTRLSFSPSKLFSVETLAIISLCLGLIVLPASMSRAAWLAFALSIFTYLVVELDLFRKLKKKWYIWALGVITFILLSSVAFILKKDSALGRLHIWKVELRAIGDAPLSGAGPGAALGAYGKAQEEYFIETDHVDEASIKVAGSPEYAFNEYLKIGMEAGVLPMLLCVAAVLSSIIKLLKKRSAFAAGAVSLSIFSFFSYPLSVIPLAVAAVILLAVAASDVITKSGREAPHLRLSMAYMILMLIIPLISLCVNYTSYKDRGEAMNKWQRAGQWSAMELYADSVDELKDLYTDLSWNYRYLYDYGYALHKTGRYRESNEVLFLGAKLSSDPMFHNIIGKNYESLEENALAESAYLKAHYMVPGRLYPMVLLMEMYLKNGMTDEARCIGMKALETPINHRNQSMVELYDRVRDKMTKNELL